MSRATDRSGGEGQPRESDQGIPEGAAPPTRSWTIQIREGRHDDWHAYESSSDGDYIVRKLKALRADGAHVRLVDGEAS